MIKESFSEGMITNGEGWIDMLEDCNKTSHIYDEAEALKIYAKIKEAHFSLLEEFHLKIQKLIKGIK